MLLIPCPHCGPRPELEFRHAGEAHLVRAPATADEEAWGAFLYARSNPRGITAERWRHMPGCDRFFNLLRDTTTDRILASYPAGGARPSLDPTGAARPSLDGEAE